MDKETIKYILREITERLSVGKKDIKNKDLEEAIGEFIEIEHQVRRLLTILYLESEEKHLDK